MSHAPGTLFRVYTADKSKHYTAVLLRDGQVLEVKNPDPDSKTGMKFPSLTMWRASHGASEEDLVVDASKGRGVVVGSETNGFNYPQEFHTAYAWARWCFEILKELAPQLLNSEALKLAYNHMVELCTKHKQELRCFYYSNTGLNRYSSSHIRWDEKKEWSGFEGYFYYYNFNYSPYSGVGHKRYSKADYDEARKEIVAAYKVILDIIKPEIEAPMSKKYKLVEAQKKIHDSQKYIKKLEQKVTDFHKSIEWYKSIIVQETAKLTQLEADLLSHKVSAL
jgi:hypothetical protein